MKKNEKTLTEIADQAEIKNAIEKFVTPQQFEILVKYAINRIKIKFNHLYNNSIGLNGITVEDIIQKVFDSFLSEGGRKWYKNKYPEFKEQFKSALDSEIYNTNKREKNNKNFRFKENLDSGGEYLSNNEDIKDTELYTYIITKLNELGADDDQLLLFDAIFIDHIKRKDFAKEYGITKQEVNNIYKKLKRKIIKINLTKYFSSYYEKPKNNKQDKRPHFK